MVTKRVFTQWRADGRQCSQPKQLPKGPAVKLQTPKPSATAKTLSQMTEVFSLPVYDSGDFVFLTRGQFLSNYSLGRKKKNSSSETLGTGFRLNIKNSKREKRIKTSYIAQGASDTSLKCRMRTLQKWAHRLPYLKSALHNPGPTHVLHYIPRRKCGKHERWPQLFFCGGRFLLWGTHGKENLEGTVIQDSPPTAHVTVHLSQGTITDCCCCFFLDNFHAKENVC